jgi:hypothetical protein
MNGEAGKGDTYRPVNKAKYDSNYLKTFGQRCPECNGSGFDCDGDPCSMSRCILCEGIGFIERSHHGRKTKQ